ncbi:hypothetical protein PC112_g15914 [Phytophthora cactorum]|nr:hypothetical protein PC112_g15914 [Phytophthora cactorum]
MPTYHGHPHESVDEFIFRAELFKLGKCIDFTNPHNGPRVVAKLAANFRDGAASWYHAKVIVEHALDQVGHFSDGLKSETKKEMIYLRCSTLAEAIAAAQAYEQPVRLLLREFKDVLPEQIPDQLPPERAVDHVVIIRPDAVPAARAPFQHYPVERAALEEYIKGLLQKGGD